MYAIVEFSGNGGTKIDISLVPLIWLHKNDRRCYWPNRTGNLTFEEFVRNETPYKKSWIAYKVQKVHYKSENYDLAEEKLTNLLEINSKEVELSGGSIKSWTKKALDFEEVDENAESGTDLESEDILSYKNTYNPPVSQTPIQNTNEEFLAAGRSFIGYRTSSPSSAVTSQPLNVSSDFSTRNRNEEFLASRSSPAVSIGYRTSSPLSAVTSQPLNVSSDFSIRNRNEEFLASRSSPALSIAYRTSSPSSAATSQPLNVSADFENSVLLCLSKIDKTIEQHSIILQQLLRTSGDSNIATPKDLPIFPIKTLSEFQVFDKKLESDGDFRQYMIRRLAAVGGSGINSLTRRIMKFLMVNEVGTLFNWKGKDKLPFEKTQAMLVIYDAAKLHFPTSEQNDHTIATTVKEWLKYSKARMKSNKINI